MKFEDGEIGIFKALEIENMIFGKWKINVEHGQMEVEMSTCSTVLCVEDGKWKSGNMKMDIRNKEK